jgi:hypothetical protein
MKIELIWWACRSACRASLINFCVTEIKIATKEFRNCAVPTALGLGLQLINLAQTDEAL